MRFAFPDSVSNLLWPSPQNLTFNESNDSQLYIIPQKLKTIIPNHQRMLKLRQHLSEIFDFYNKKFFLKAQSWKNYKKLEQNQKLTEITLNLVNSSIDYPSFEQNETYSIEITSKNQIILNGDNYYGILRALTTFMQLLQYDSNKQLYCISGIPIRIYDFPDYHYRSIMVDTSRHFIPKNDLLRTFDGMMLNKLNTFHWHITDTQSFPMYMRRHPGLSENGCYLPELVYTIADIKEIVKYAQVRGIRVVPEIDTPGHLESWKRDPSLSDIFCVSCSIIDISKNSTYEVIRDILLDLDEYFPDLYQHMGGDEVSSSCWKHESIQEALAAEGVTKLKLYQAYFQKRQKEILLEINKKRNAIYWIVGSEPQEQFQESDVLQYWGGHYSYQNLVRLFPKNRLILSPISLLYFNCGFGTCGSFSSWDNIYKIFSPLLEPTKKKEEGTNANIIGAEACLWSEQNNQFTLDQRLWIRGSALAEIVLLLDLFTFYKKLWNLKARDEQTDKQIMKRIVKMEEKLMECGFAIYPISSEYCEKNIDACK